MNSFFRIIQQSTGNIQSDYNDKNVTSPFVINRSISNFNNYINTTNKSDKKDNYTLTSKTEKYKYGFEKDLREKNIVPNSDKLLNIINSNTGVITDHELFGTDSDKNLLVHNLTEIQSCKGINRIKEVNEHGRQEQPVQNNQNNPLNIYTQNTLYSVPIKSANDLKYWEYGNYGIKIKNFDRIMCKNLSILYYIDRTFSYLLNRNISIKKIFGKNFSKNYIIDTNKINCSNGKVNIELVHGKISGTYQLIAAGSSVISNVRILPEELKKFRVPDLDDVLENLDNLKLIIKLANILNLFNNFDMKNDFSDPALDLFKIITNSLETILQYKNNDNDKKLLKSNSSNALYIKIYDSYGKAFVIDSDKKLIYYICEKIIESEKKIVIKYYVLSVDQNWKIN